MVDSHGGHYSRGAKPLRGRTLQEISGIAARGGATGRRMWAVAAARARRLKRVVAAVAAVAGPVVSVRVPMAVVTPAAAPARPAAGNRRVGTVQ
ncbi:hypothetical protein KTE29_15820 [Burkholderia multivorans]|uniref:hypothetical protein n=1 Tax=Burkholderia multivorans TaxID=87883 RepID=UPI001C22904A|nr:hypothetical protein [Burkholderia multivorans]MBU9449237.1 hypothetical protein [Burkholderia multivorans]